MNSVSELVFLNERFEVKRIRDEFWPIEFFFLSLLERPDSKKRLADLLERQGFGFEMVSCIAYDPTEDPDEEPFEVRFRISHWGGDPDEMAYVTWEQFYDLLHLAAKSHLHRHPEDEAELRRMFKEKGVAFDMKE